MKADAIPSLMWQSVSERIAQHAGLYFPPERLPDLQRGLTSAAVAGGFPDVASCVRQLLSLPMDQSILHTVVSHLAIGDTYFFRESKMLEVLAEHVLPELIRTKPHVRLWSAACSTGEEPYSLAILVHQLLGGRQDPHVSILATDINEQSLGKATAGVYGEWSFRDCPPHLKQRFFTRTPEGRFAIHEDIRRRVRFARFNLAWEYWPPLVTGTNAMDVILCRNVLMYFSPAKMRGVLDNLAGALTAGGWLAVSSTECSRNHFQQFTAVGFPDCTTLYRKDCPATHRQALSPDTERTPEPPREPPAPCRRARKKTAISANTPDQLAELTRSLADQGKLVEALASATRWVAVDRQNPRAHYLEAMVRQELGDRAAARRALQRAIYLEPEFVVAHFALGNLAQGEARADEARRHFTNALALLQDSPPGQLLPESPDTTAAGLAQIIRELLERRMRPQAGSQPTGDPMSRAQQ